MKSKDKRPYLKFLKEYALKKKLIPLYGLVIRIIILTVGVSLVRPELQGKVIDDLGAPQNTNLSSFMLLLAIFLGLFTKQLSYELCATVCGGSDIRRNSSRYETKNGR